MFLNLRIKHTCTFKLGIFFMSDFKNMLKITDIALWRHIRYHVVYEYYKEQKYRLISPLPYD